VTFSAAQDRANFVPLHVMTTLDMPVPKGP
jgi:hypothetical protein